MWRCVWREWFEFLGPSFFVNLVITGDLKICSEPAHILVTALQDFLLFFCIFFGHRDWSWKSQQALVHFRKITLQRSMIWTAQFAGFGERLANPLVKFQNILISFRYNFLDCWGGWWRWRLEGSDPELFSPPSSFSTWSAPKMWDQSTNHVTHLTHLIQLIIHHSQFVCTQLAQKVWYPERY